MAACNGDAEYQRVDFGKRIDAETATTEQSERPRMQVAVAAMISPKETSSHYRELVVFLLDRLGFEAELVQRKTYSEVNRLLAQGEIDLAFICTGPFVRHRDANGFEAVATPVVRGEPHYRSYLIVHRDSPLNTLTDLRGKDFAFTDPDSNTGALVPRYWLHRMDTTAEAFFGSFTYTYSHDNSIMAVAKRLVDGAAVDGHLWDYYQQHNGVHTSQTRVIKISEPFGSPPVVVSRQMNPELKAALVDQILSMHQDPEGRRILSSLAIDRFVVPDMAWYLPVKKMIRWIDPSLEAADGT